MKHLQGCYGFTPEIQLWNLFGHFFNISSLEIETQWFSWFCDFREDAVVDVGMVNPSPTGFPTPSLLAPAPPDGDLPAGKQKEKKTTPMFRWLLAVESNSHVYDQARATHFEMTAATR